MPSISAHMVVAKEVAKILNINNDDFIKGNLLPDIIDEEDSHHKIKKGVYLIPDINYFKDNMNFDNYLNIGYLTHLLLDKHYLEDYLAKLYPNRNIFLDGRIYKDYDYLNHLLVNKYALNTNSLEKILNMYDCKIIKEKLKYNIECLKQKESGKTYYLNFDSFSEFLNSVSKTISEELIKYANKSHKLSICIR